MSQYKVMKSFGDKSLFELQSTQVSSSVSWDRLKPYLEQAVNIKGNEFIEGIAVDDFGVKVIVGYKQATDKK